MIDPPVVVSVLHEDVRFYLNHSEHWTPDRRLAREFFSEGQATTFLGDHGFYVSLPHCGCEVDLTAIEILRLP